MTIPITFAVHVIMAHRTAWSFVAACDCALRVLTIEAFLIASSLALKPLLADDCREFSQWFQFAAAFAGKGRVPYKSIATYFAACTLWSSVLVHGVNKLLWKEVYLRPFPRLFFLRAFGSTASEELFIH